MGPQYLQFYLDTLKKETKRNMWSAGIVGAGDRATMKEFLNKLLTVMTDPTLTASTQKGEFQQVNMAAVTYVAERFFGGRTFKGGAPLNSVYRKYERGRRDVWFIHK